MLKFNKRELEILYEGINELLRDDNIKFSYKELQLIQDLQEKLRSTGKITREKLNETVQILDKVVYDKARGYVTGQIDGKMIVMVQGSTYLVDPKELKEFNTKPDESVKPHMKFDDKTQKLLFEQYVKCGIYQGNIPVRVTNCFVRFDHWKVAQPDEQIKVLVEGNTVFLEKDQIKIFENVSDFANPDNYVPGVLIDQGTGTAIENVLVNVIDYTNTLGDADSVKIIRETPNGDQEIQTVPKAMVTTLTF
jgi:hypothetical protein